MYFVFFFFQAEDGIRDGRVTGVQTCALPILYTPRSAFGPKACPWAPTHTMSGLAGCTRTREICCVSASPTKAQVLPASVVLNTPSPCETLPRIGYSPVPT